MDVYHIGFSDRKLCIWDVPPATANRRFAGNFFKIYSISIIYKSGGAVCRLHCPRRLFGASSPFAREYAKGRVRPLRAIPGPRPWMVGRPGSRHSCWISAHAGRRAHANASSSVFAPPIEFPELGLLLLGDAQGFAIQFLGGLGMPLPQRARVGLGRVIAHDQFTARA